MNRKFFSLVLISLIGIAAALITAAYYNQLRADYAQLRADYAQLKVDYDVLSQAYSILEAVKGLAIDETIEITVNKEYMGDEYIVKGNVTNIGDAPIPTLYVFIFGYTADGSLWPYYDYVMIENLYPGETNAYESSAPLDESYTFKVFAVGNYN